MRRPAPSLFLSLLLCLLTAGAAHAAVAPRSADRFVGSIGVNVHMTYKDTAYAQRDRLVSKLQAAGIRHVRDGLHYDTQYAYDTFNRMAALGIKTTFIMGDPTERSDTLPELIDTLRQKVPAAAEAVEGPNEYSRSGRGNWAGELRSYQRRLYDAVKADSALRRLPVVAPSLISPQDHDRLGSLASADQGNKHSYPSGDMPEQNVTDELSTASRVTRSRPTVVTESGYHNALNSTDGHRSTSEAATATYLPRMFLEYFRRGIPRTFAYELIDEWPDARRTNLEANFGLLRNDYSEKPAFRSLSNLIATVRDGGGRVTPRALGYTVQNAPGDLRELLLQHPDGSYSLVLWRAVRVWDPVARRPIAPGNRTLTLDLPSPSAISLVAPVRSRGVYAKTIGSSVSVRLGGDPVVVQIAPPGGRPGIAIPAGQRIGSVLRRGLQVRFDRLAGSNVRVLARHRSQTFGRLSMAVSTVARRSAVLQPTRSGRRLLRAALRSGKPLTIAVSARMHGGGLVSARATLRR